MQLFGQQPSKGLLFYNQLNGEFTVASDSWALTPASAPRGVTASDFSTMLPAALGSVQYIVAHDKRHKHWQLLVLLPSSAESSESSSSSVGEGPANPCEPTGKAVKGDNSCDYSLHAASLPQDIAANHTLFVLQGAGSSPVIVDYDTISGAYESFTLGESNLLRQHADGPRYHWVTLGGERRFQGTLVPGIFAMMLQADNGREQRVLLAAATQPRSSVGGAPDEVLPMLLEVRVAALARTGALVLRQKYLVARSPQQAPLEQYPSPVELAALPEPPTPSTVHQATQSADALEAHLSSAASNQARGAVPPRGPRASIGGRRSAFMTAASAALSAAPPHEVNPSDDGGAAPQAVHRPTPASWVIAGAAAAPRVEDPWVGGAVVKAVDSEASHLVAVTRGGRCDVFILSPDPSKPQGAHVGRQRWLQGCTTLVAVAPSRLLCYDSVTGEHRVMEVVAEVPLPPVLSLAEAQAACKALGGSKHARLCGTWLEDVTAFQQALLSPDDVPPALDVRAAEWLVARRAEHAHASVMFAQLADAGLTLCYVSTLQELRDRLPSGDSCTLCLVYHRDDDWRWSAVPRAAADGGAEGGAAGAAAAALWSCDKAARVVNHLTTLMQQGAVKQPLLVLDVRHLTDMGEEFPSWAATLQDSRESGLSLAVFRGTTPVATDFTPNLRIYGVGSSLEAEADDTAQSPCVRWWGTLGLNAVPVTSWHLEVVDGAGKVQGEAIPLDSPQRAAAPGRARGCAALVVEGALAGECNWLASRHLRAALLGESEVTQEQASVLQECVHLLQRGANPLRSHVVGAAPLEELAPRLLQKVVGSGSGGDAGAGDVRHLITTAVDLVLGGWSHQGTVTDLMTDLLQVTHRSKSASTALQSKMERLSSWQHRLVGDIVADGIRLLQPGLYEATPSPANYETLCANLVDLLFTNPAVRAEVRRATGDSASDDDEANVELQRPGTASARMAATHTSALPTDKADLITCMVEGAAGLYTNGKHATAAVGGRPRRSSARARRWGGDDVVVRLDERDGHTDTDSDAGGAEGKGDDGENGGDEDAYDDGYAQYKAAKDSAAVAEQDDDPSLAWVHQLARGLAVPHDVLLGFVYLVFGNPRGLKLLSRKLGGGVPPAPMRHLMQRLPRDPQEIVLSRKAAEAELAAQADDYTHAAEAIVEDGGEGAGAGAGATAAMKQQVALPTTARTMRDARRVRGGEEAITEADINTEKAAKQLSYAQQFHQFDRDGSGTMTMDEFKDVSATQVLMSVWLPHCTDTPFPSQALAYYGIPISDHKLHELFASVGAHSSTHGAVIGQRGFVRAMHKLQKDLVSQALALLGMSRGELFAWAGALIFLLILLLVFLMAGIAAYSQADSFGAAINAALAGLSGLAVAVGSAKQTKSEEEADEESPQAVDEAVENVSTASHDVAVEEE